MMFISYLMLRHVSASTVSHLQGAPWFFYAPTRGKKSTRVIKWPKAKA